MGGIWQQENYLKLSREQGLPRDDELKKGRIFKFKKPGNRLYALDEPLDLISADWKAKAKVLIREFSVGKGRTEGEFIIAKTLTKKDSEAINNNLIPYNQ